MLRPLYRWILLAHPPAFRRRFGDEILAIFDACPRHRDRYRLLLDGLHSLLRQWTLRPEFWHPNPQPAEVTADGVPSFQSLDPFRPRTSAVFQGLVLSIAVFCLTCFAIRYSWIRVLHISIPEVQFERPQWIPPVSNGNAVLGAPSLQPAVETEPPNAAPPIPATASSRTQPTLAPRAAIRDPRSTAQPSQKVRSTRQLPSDTPVVPQQQIAAAGSTASALTENVTLDAAERRRVIAGASANLKHYYVYPDAAEKMANALEAHETNGDDESASDGDAFASLLTTQMRDVSHDQHLMVLYNATGSSERNLGSTPEELARYRNEMERTNCTFEKVAILRQNIGYVKLNSFPEPTICQSTVAGAMASLNQADAIIFDLRDNRGGSPSMVALMASYLFEHPTHLDDLYNRSGDSTLQSWTLSPVPENELANKPAYVLISPSTFSGAEEFAYDLKLLKRATLVGETTAGAAHMVRRHRIDEHFTIGVPDTRPINPISRGDWEGTGVTPDVSVKADDALRTAESLAVRNLEKK
jgi:hypothetical protein